LVYIPVTENEEKHQSEKSLKLIDEASGSTGADLTGCRSMSTMGCAKSRPFRRKCQQAGRCTPTVFVACATKQLDRYAVEKHSYFNGFEWESIGIETEGKCAGVENMQLPRRICGIQTQ
jgi:hypothetical protein